MSWSSHCFDSTAAQIHGPLLRAELARPAAPWIGGLSLCRIVTRPEVMEKYLKYRWSDHVPSLGQPPVGPGSPALFGEREWHRGTLWAE